jgi:coenzyme F420-0:L-glutamate ligase/coenzyme F420-1:gamma-L-glutamate ligase
MSLTEVRVIGLPDIPVVMPGADLAALIQQAAAAAPLPLQTGDILVVTQKIVSKAEGCLIALKDVTPSPWAEQYARQWGKDPRHVEVVLRQSRRIVRMDRGVLIAETHHGLICANAGVDQSNIEGEEIVAVLPLDPDASARAIRQELRERCGCEVAVIISDTFGRPWRDGIVNVAIGLSGLEAIKDYTGSLAVADELAAAAELVMNKLDNVPVAVIRGYDYPRGEGSLAQLIRAAERDLFR